MDRMTAMTTLVLVIDSGSFSAAARQLNVGQPAVSKTIAQLENRLGVRLLVRSTRGLTPTEAGIRYYERAKRSIEEANEAEADARNAGAGLTGTLRLSAPTTFARLHIVPHLSQFMDAHPNLTIELILDDRIIDLVREGIDLSLRIGTLADSAAVARKIGHSNRSVIATKAYLAANGEPQTPADLSHHKTLIYTQGRHDCWSFTGRNGSVASVTVTGQLRANSAEGIRAAVLADMGITIATDWMFAPELASGAVQRILSSWSLPPTDLWAVFPTGKLASAKARAFSDFVAGIAARSPVEGL
jgi:DNA-binding transcriptional LysR family regulator